MLGLDLRCIESLVDFLGEITVKHLMMFLVQVDLHLECPEIGTLLDLLDLKQFGRASLHLYILEPSFFQHLIKLKFEDGLIDDVLSLFELFASVRILQNREDIDAVLSQVEHLQIRIYLVFGFLSQGHLLLHTLSEC